MLRVGCDSKDKDWTADAVLVPGLQILLLYKDWDSYGIQQDSFAEMGYCDLSPLHELEGHLQPENASGTWHIPEVRMVHGA